jgi:ribosomal protein S17E
MYGKRETPRQGIIRDAAKALYERYGYMSAKTYHQNVWGVMAEVTSKNVFRNAYWNMTSALAKKRLYREIARKAHNVAMSNVLPAWFERNRHSYLKDAEL